MDFKQIISAALVLFSVIDIFGSIPIIIDLKNKGKVINSEMATLVSGGLMILFLFFGANLLGLFGVDIYSFAIAGGLIIFFIGLEMILGIRLFRDDIDDDPRSTIVPIAFPIIAGAGTMTTIISLKSEYDTINLLIAIVLNLILVYVVLKSSRWLQKILGKRGANVLRKIFGIILLAIAIKLIGTNIGSFLINFDILNGH